MLGLMRRQGGDSPGKSGDGKHPTNVVWERRLARSKDTAALEALANEALKALSKAPTRALRLVAARALDRLGDHDRAAPLWEELARTPNAREDGPVLLGLLDNTVKRAGRSAARQWLDGLDEPGTGRASLVRFELWQRLEDRTRADAFLKRAERRIGDDPRLQMALSRRALQDGRAELAYAHALAGQSMGHADPGYLAQLRRALAAAECDPLAVEALGPAEKEDHYAARILLRIIERARRLTPAAAYNPGRIVLTTSSLGSGGAERQLALTAAGLKRDAALDPVVLANSLSQRRDGAFFAPAVREAGVKLVDVSTGADPQRPPPGIDPDIWSWTYGLPGSLGVSIRRTVGALRTLRPETVFAWQDGTAVRTGVAALVAGVPRLALAFRSMPPQSRNLGSAFDQPVLGELASEKSVRLTNNSARGAAAYAGYLGVDAARVSVIRNGFTDAAEGPPDRDIAEEAEAWRKRSPGAVVMGTVMRLDENKRPLLWLEAASRLETPSRFLIVGDGPMAGEARQAARSLGLEDRVLFTGRSSTPRFWMREMDLFVLISKVEGLPNTLVEAQWEGVCVAAADNGGMAEACAPHASTLINEIDVRDPEVLARRLDAILSDREALRRDGEKARRFVRDTFSAERMIDEMKRFLTWPD